MDSSVRTRARRRRRQARPCTAGTPCMPRSSHLRRRCKPDCDRASARMHPKWEWGRSGSTEASCGSLGVVPNCWRRCPILRARDRQPRRHRNRRVDRAPERLRHAFPLKAVPTKVCCRLGLFPLRSESNPARSCTTAPCGSAALEHRHRRRCRRGRPGPRPVPVQVRGSSPGADVAGVSPVPAQMWPAARPAEGSRSTSCRTARRRPRTACRLHSHALPCGPNGGGRASE
jgi:hypothetical protein